MSYLMRISLPDLPGMLGELAAALGSVDGDIRSVDVVGTTDDGSVIDDILVDLPHNRLPDALISAAQELEGVTVDSLRPYSGTVDRRGQVDMLSAVADQREDLDAALDSLLTDLPKAMTVGWAIVLDSEPTTHRVGASSGAPADNGKTLETPPVTEARVLVPERESWVPHTWSILDTPLAATPLSGTSMILVIGRPGGPEFLRGEITHLKQLGTILGAFFSTKHS